MLCQLGICLVKLGDSRICVQLDGVGHGWMENDPIRLNACNDHAPSLNTERLAKRFRKRQGTTRSNLNRRIHEIKITVMQ